MNRIVKNIVLGVLLLLPSVMSFSQVPNLAGNTQREEIQRYFGYEILPYRYLSMPYDACINNNETALFVEIGFIYIAFLPLLILLFLYKRVWARILIIGYLIFTWIIATSNSFVFSFKHAVLDDNKMSYADYLLDGEIGFLAEPSAHIASCLYYVSNLIYQPLLALTNMVSGDKDYMTYPLLIGIFLLGTFVLNKWLVEVKVHNKILVLVFWFFMFFWMKYSAGIVWYGFPVLVFALLLIFKLQEIGNNLYPLASRAITYTLYGCTMVWIISAMVLRFGEVQNNNETKDLGKDMFSSIFYKYQVGEFSSTDVMNNLYPGNFDKALAKINSESESLIYRVGTSFSYFIKDNSKRIILDNQLGLFNQIQSTYKDVDEIRKALKASNIRYMIIDLNTPYIDKTPEKTLQTKYYRMMYFFRNASGLRLLSTNRAIRSIDSNGDEVLTFEVFGKEELKGKDIYYGGQYAIYEIL